MMLIEQCPIKIRLSGLQKQQQTNEFESGSKVRKSAHIELNNRIYEIESIDNSSSLIKGSSSPKANLD